MGRHRFGELFHERPQPALRPAVSVEGKAVRQPPEDLLRAAAQIGEQPRAGPPAPPARQHVPDGQQLKFSDSFIQINRVEGSARHGR